MDIVCKKRLSNKETDRVSFRKANLFFCLPVTWRKILDHRRLKDLLGNLQYPLTPASLIFYYMPTTSISQNTDLLSGLKRAAFDDVGRVWTGKHSKGSITREVCVKQTELYTSPIVSTPVMGLHKEGICYDWIPISGGCCHEAGVGSHLSAHHTADFVRVVQHRCTHAVTCPCLT